MTEQNSNDISHLEQGLATPEGIERQQQLEVFGAENLAARERFTYSPEMVQKFTATVQDLLHDEAIIQNDELAIRVLPRVAIPPTTLARYIATPRLDAEDAPHPLQDAPLRVKSFRYEYVYPKRTLAKWTLDKLTDAHHKPITEVQEDMYIAPDDTPWVVRTIKDLETGESKWAARQANDIDLEYAITIIKSAGRYAGALQERSGQSPTDGSVKEKDPQVALETAHPGQDALSQTLPHNRRHLPNESAQNPADHMQHRHSRRYNQ